MGIVSSARRAGHCAELTAGPSEACPRPLPGGSPIKMCRNARRKGKKKKKKSSAELGPNVKITARRLIMGNLAAAAVAGVRAPEGPVYSLIKGLQT